MFCAGVVCWLIYGLLVEDIPVIVANAVTLVLAGTVLVLAITYRRRADQPTD
jgi:MtN3 and saliva related transmembrane protein